MLTEEESTNIEDLFREGKKPELLPLTMFCKALGSEVSAYHSKGNPNEFPTELRTIVHTSTSDFVLVPSREGSYFERLFWGIWRTSIVPVALLTQVSDSDSSAAASESAGRRLSTRGPAEAGDASAAGAAGRGSIYESVRRMSMADESRVAITIGESFATVKKVVAVVTGKITDIFILSMALRFAEQRNVEVAVLITNDRRTFDKVRILIIYIISKTKIARRIFCYGFIDGIAGCARSFSLGQEVSFPGSQLGDR